jgi:hypothetical protein
VLSILQIDENDLETKKVKINYSLINREASFLVLIVLMLTPIVAVWIVFVTDKPYLFLVIMSIFAIVYYHQAANTFLTSEHISLVSESIFIEKKVWGMRYYSKKIEYKDLQKCYVYQNSLTPEEKLNLTTYEIKLFTTYSLRIVKLDIKMKPDQKHWYEKTEGEKKWIEKKPGGLSEPYINMCRKMWGSGETYIFSFGNRMSIEDAQRVVDTINGYKERAQV